MIKSFGRQGSRPTTMPNT